MGVVNFYGAVKASTQLQSAPMSKVISVILLSESLLGDYKSRMHRKTNHNVSVPAVLVSGQRSKPAAATPSSAVPPPSVVLTNAVSQHQRDIVLRLQIPLNLAFCTGSMCAGTDASHSNNVWSYGSPFISPLMEVLCYPVNPAFNKLFTFSSTFMTHEHFGAQAIPVCILTPLKQQSTGNSMSATGGSSGTTAGMGVEEATAAVPSILKLRVAVRSSLCASLTFHDYYDYPTTVPPTTT
eukprot:Lankesteria_metandrocarpae@DN6377_c0_g1_i1.p1